MTNPTTNLAAPAGGQLPPGAEVVSSVTMPLRSPSANHRPRVAVGVNPAQPSAKRPPAPEVSFDDLPRAPTKPLPASLVQPSVQPAAVAQPIAVANGPIMDYSMAVAPTLAKPTSEKDPSYVAVDLPSQYFFYPFKDLSIGTMRVKHQAKMARAAKETSSRVAIETISSLLGDGVSAMDLTVPDYYWVMYWIRLDSFPKTPFTFDAVCSNKDHIAKVQAGEQHVDTLRTLDIVNKTSLVETRLDIEKVVQFFTETDVSVFTKDGYTLTGPRMRDVLALEEMMAAMTNGGEDPTNGDALEFEYMGDLASCLIRKDGEPSTLQERLDYVAELPADITSTLSKFWDIVSEYGIKESIATRCKGCNAVIETEIAITAYNFF